MKTTIFTAYNTLKKQLKAAGIENYQGEAKIIIRHITGLGNAQILTEYERELTPLQQTVLRSITARRCTRYPLQYLLGHWEFYGIDFSVGEGVLVPRPDSETVVDTALEFLKDKSFPAVLDLCAGSGCLSVAVAKNSNAAVTAIEKYDAAFKYLTENTEKSGADVTAVKADIFDFTPDGKFDLIISNPPYVSAAEMDIIDAETSFEPDTALYGGEDGLLFYRKIARDYKKYIKSGGMLVFEVGFSQSESVKEILKITGYSGIGSKRDLSGIERVVFGTVN